MQLQLVAPRCLLCSSLLPNRTPNSIYCDYPLGWYVVTGQIVCDPLFVSARFVHRSPMPLLATVYVLICINYYEGLFKTPK